MAERLLMKALGRLRTRDRRNERGAVALLAALVSSGLFLTAALVIDLGLARDVKRQSQNASDASALAAANALYPDDSSCTSVLDVAPPCYRDAVAEAKAYAASNYGTTDADWDACNDPDSKWVVPLTTDCVSFTDDAEGSLMPTDPTKVRVVMPMRDVDVIFGASADVEKIGIGTTARAKVDSGTWKTCGLCFLGPVDAVNGDFVVTGGDIHVNGDLDAGPNGVWNADGIGVVGAVTGGQFNPPPASAPPITDPWGSRTDLPPLVAGLPQKNNPCGATGGTGIYGAVQLNNNQTCNLQPGLYVIPGATWSQKNLSLFTGTGVTLYFTCGTKPAPLPCAPGEVGGKLDAKNGTVAISAPTAAPTDGAIDVAIMYDRNNTATIDLQGNGATGITGAVYAKSAKLNFNGNSCFGFSGGPVIVNGVVLANGNKSCVTVTDPNNTDIYELPGEIALDR